MGVGQRNTSGLCVKHPMTTADSCGLDQLFQLQMHLQVAHPHFHADTLTWKPKCRPIFQTIWCTIASQGPVSREGSCGAGPVHVVLIHVGMEHKNGRSEQQWPWRGPTVACAI
jgi:hypothetical protein